jgi:parallel beta-helix repeat protein
MLCISSYLVVGTPLAIHRFDENSYTQYHLLTQQNIIYVDDDNTHGPWDGTFQHPYQTINQALPFAQSNDIIYIFNGSYHETIIIEKPLHLIGQQRNTTILDGDYAPIIITITSPQVTIENITLRNSGGYRNNTGITLLASNTSIINCTIYRTKTGILLYNSSRAFIQDCTFYSNGEGIYSLNSQHLTIDTCILYHNAIGINLEKSTESSIRNTSGYINGIACFIIDSSIIEITDCAFFNNNDNQGGIFLQDSHNIYIHNCNIYHNGAGIRIANATRIWITSCSLTANTHFAVHVDENSQDIIILDCVIFENLRYAVYIKDQSTVTIHNTNLYDNTLYGFYIEDGHVDAQNNWWGGFRGPTMFEHGKTDRITMKPTYTRFIPWTKIAIHDVGATWNLTPSTYPIALPPVSTDSLILPGEDSDNDLVPNWWEIKWNYDPYIWDNHTVLDPDKDGLTNLQECYMDQYGSNPYHKDVFVEFDWMTPVHPTAPSNKPSETLLHKVQVIFDEQDITLHVDLGDLGGGEEIPNTANFTYADLRDLYWDYFLHNNLNNPRKGIFHYCLVCDYGPGPGFAFIGWDHLDSFDISAQMLQNNQPSFDRATLIVGGAIHELGHTLGLTVDDYGGNDNMGVTKLFSRQWFKYHNYKSCMNYYWTYTVLFFSDGSHGRGDFNDWIAFDYTFFKNTHFTLPI